MKEEYHYSKKIMKHFFKPHNVGELKNYDGIGEAGNLICGDKMRLYIKVKGGKITNVSFQTFGCIVAIANTSLLTTMIKGKTLEQALKITKSDMVKKLGQPLPPIKIHCSVLAVDALTEAIYNYLLKNKLPISEELKDSHERIQKETKMIEERHKDFVKMEKEMLENQRTR